MEKEARPLMFCLAFGERLEKPAFAALNRMLDRTVDPLTGDPIEDLPLIHFGKVRKGDVVITIDEEAFHALTKWTGHESLRGYVFESHGGAYVVPTYSPERIRKGSWHLASVFQRDILRGLDVHRNGPPQRLDSYLTYPSPEELAAFMAPWDPRTQPLAFDIETPYSGAKDENMSFDEDPSFTILMVSLAYEPHRAVSVPWSPPFDTMVARYLGSATRSLVWNAPFDVPRLQANGVDFEGEVIDVMLAWHWLEPALPMGLKFVAPFYCPEMPAWKLEQENNMAWYNAADSDTLLRCFLGIEQELREQDRWHVFERHFLEYGKLLRKMGRRGVLVNQETRREDSDLFEKKLRGIEADIQPHVPAECKPHHPKRGYKATREVLEKQGKWVEGGMREITVELSERDLEVRARAEERAKKKAMDQLHAEAKRLNRAFDKERRKLEKKKRASDKASARKRK